MIRDIVIIWINFGIISPFIEIGSSARPSNGFKFTFYSIDMGHIKGKPIFWVTDQV